MARAQRMKIGILTLAKAGNYGGILQNYALQSVLKRLGHDVLTLDFEWKNKTHRGSFWKKMIRRVIGEREILLQQFIEKNVNITEFLGELSSHQQVEKYGFDAYIVGSDQVWRPDLVLRTENFFLDFLAEKHDVKKIAYAASFGHDTWQYPSDATQRCSDLAQKFNVISVRELSGVQLCQNYLGVDAQFVLDPTLLLNVVDYLELLEQRPFPFPRGRVLKCIYEDGETKRRVLKKTAEVVAQNEEGYVNLIPTPARHFFAGGRMRYAFCSVEDWLRAFRDADFVVTDSFHAAVFSIIFEKNFLVVADRAPTRFHSLLGLLGLEDRTIKCFDEKEIVRIASSPIDWDRVKEKLFVERQRSLDFLAKALE